MIDCDVVCWVEVIDSDVIVCFVVCFDVIFGWYVGSYLFVRWCNSCGLRGWFGNGVESLFSKNLRRK